MAANGHSAQAAANSAKHVSKWWKEAVVYQIYPASFKDSTGNGLGDLPGITSKLDYLKSVGVSCLWINPHYKSPQYDLGYDISDYQDVYEPYGKLEDCDALIKGAHERGMKILFDLVVNHTSHQHKWFIESRSSKDNPKRDWYFWRPARYVDGKRMPPTNWQGAFQGSVWTWDEKTQEYYLHLFTPEQPDLNWENPEVRQAIYDEAILFWLKRGVDGFRIDTANMYSKRLPFEDVPVTVPGQPWQPAGQMFSNGPRIHEFLKEMYSTTFEKYDAFTIGELPNTPRLEDILSFVSEDAKQFSTVIQFDLADLDHGGGRWTLMSRPWKLSQFKKITVMSQELTEPQYKAWACTYLENHDQARSVTRYASEAPEHRVNSAKMLATYILTLSGTPIIYEGEEIGMINMPKSWDIDTEYKDIGTINVWKEIKEAAEKENKPELLEQGRKSIQLTARDHSRTPMQWDSSPQAGFSTNPDTWMRVMDSYKDINVASQEKDASSVLNYYRQLLALRQKQKDLLVYGHFTLHQPSNEETLVYTKSADGNWALIALNFTKDPQPLTIPEGFEGGRLEISTTASKGSDMTMQPFEARIYFKN